jgi:hypothetical protein
LTHLSLIRAAVTLTDAEKENENGGDA